ncbi:MAG TPA: hypothetical protein DHU33_03200 [Firmicutes bacterium]|nr:hypothetical protein [Bacillota bacterium]
MNKVVTRIYPESVIKKYQSKINTLGSSTIIDVYTFLLSRLLLEIILFILLVLIPKYGLIISTITVIFIHFLYEDVLITSKIMNREERLDKDALEFFNLLSLGLKSNASIYNVFLTTSKVCNNTLSKEFLEGLKKDNMEVCYTYVYNHIPNQDLKTYLEEMKLTKDKEDLSKVVTNLNQVLSAKKDTKEQNFLNKLPLKAITSTIIYLALVLLLLLLAPKFL